MIWCHTFKMAATTSFHTEKCCHPVSAHAASVRPICISVRQFLFHSIGLLYIRTCSGKQVMAITSMELVFPERRFDGLDCCSADCSVLLASHVTAV